MQRTFLTLPILIVTYNRYNLVANIAYGERYKDVFPIIQEKIASTQGRLFEEVRATVSSLARSNNHSSGQPFVVVTNQ